MADAPIAIRLPFMLDQAERAVDEAIARVASLAGGAPACLTTPLGAARENLIDLHRALARTAIELGIEGALAGPVDKPEDRPTSRRGGR